MARKAGKDSGPETTARGAGAATRERLLDAAERLFAEEGLERTSLRALTEAAGTNVASVNYHFGSKEGLFREVIQRAMRPVNDEQSAGLEELEDRAREPSVEELLRAFVSPYVGLSKAREDGGMHMAKLVMRILTDPGERTREVAFEGLGDVDERYIAAFARVLPGLGEEEIRWRLGALAGVVVFKILGRFDLGPYGTAPGDEEQENSRLISFLAAGMQARSPAAPGR